MQSVYVKVGKQIYSSKTTSFTFFWLELCPGFPISGAIADVLLSRSLARSQSVDRQLRLVK